MYSEYPNQIVKIIYTNLMLITFMCSFHMCYLNIIKVYGFWSKLWCIQFSMPIHNKKVEWKNMVKENEQWVPKPNWFSSKRKKYCNTIGDPLSSFLRIKYCSQLMQTKAAIYKKKKKQSRSSSEQSVIVHQENMQ